VPSPSTRRTRGRAAEVGAGSRLRPASIAGSALNFLHSKHHLSSIAQVEALGSKSRKGQRGGRHKHGRGRSCHGLAQTHFEASQSLSGCGIPLRVTRLLVLQRDRVQAVIRAIPCAARRQDLKHRRHRLVVTSQRCRHQHRPLRVPTGPADVDVAGRIGLRESLRQFESARPLAYEFKSLWIAQSEVASASSSRRSSLFRLAAPLIQLQGVGR
jgi:hypothetical protein